jgi:hypothetical protein
MSGKVEPRDISTLMSSTPEPSLSGGLPWEEPSWDARLQSGVGMPDIRAVHLSPTDGSLALHLWPTQTGLPLKLIGELPASEFVSARRLLSIPILQV